jgi:heptosyltransferase-3
VLLAGPDAEARVAHLIKAAGIADRPLVQFHPGSRWLFKTWPADKCAALLRSLAGEGHAVVITGASDAQERRFVDTVLEQAGVPVTDLAGRLSLKELAALSARAAVFVGVDSAPMHIAAAMGTAVVALFGPSGETEWAPWTARARVLVSGHPCRPCGRDGCGGGKVSDCLVEISVDRVLSAIREFAPAPGARAGFGGNAAR